MTVALLDRPPTATEDQLEMGKAQLRRGRADYLEDMKYLAAGVLDPVSFRNGWRPMTNPVEVRTTSLVPEGKHVDPDLLVLDPAAYTEPMVRKDGLIGDAAYDGRPRYYREIRRTHNLQLTVGKNQIQRIQSFGDVGSSLNGLLAAYTGTTATTLTGASGLPTATSSAGNAGLQGHLVYVQNSTIANSVLGVIVSNTEIGRAHV